jgi:uncharacterized protein YebE (UPF0316 family)
MNKKYKLKLSHKHLDHPYIVYEYDSEAEKEKAIIEIVKKYNIERFKIYDTSLELDPSISVVKKETKF